MENEDKIVGEVSQNDSQNYSQINNDELINAYIGVNAEKLRKGKFSLWTCLFGTAYVFYRKMWLLGFAWHLLNMFISLITIFVTLKIFNVVELFQSSTYSTPAIIVFVISCILNIIVSFLFKKLYIKKATKKVEKIKQRNSDKTNEELKKICAKKGSTTVIGIVVAILLSGAMKTICEPIIEKIISNEMDNKFVEATVYAYSIISSVESTYTDTLLEMNKDILTIEDIKKEYNSPIYTWNDDNTITSKNSNYDLVCNVIVNSNNEMIVECDINGKKIKSDLLSLENSSNNDDMNENINNNNELNDFIGEYVAVSSDSNNKEYFILNSDGTANIYFATGDGRILYANKIVKYSLVTENGKKVLKFDTKTPFWNTLDAEKTNNEYKFIPREVGPSPIDLTFEKKSLILQLGEDLYEYANNVGWCKEFKYLHNQPGGSIVLNYEEVTNKFTQNYLSLSTNIFSRIKKGEDGKYYDLSVCGFGVSCATISLTELKIINIEDNYVTFEATATTTSTGCGDKEAGSVVKVDKQTFAIKKENDIWKIDNYTFQYVTD